MLSQQSVLPRRTAVLGAGTIGEAMLSGLLRAGADPADLVFCERYDARAAQVQERTGVERMLEPAKAVLFGDVLVLAVKPQDLPALLDEIAAGVTTSHLVVSVAAGISTETIQAHLPAGTPVVRVMPNTAVLVDEGMSAVAGGSCATEQHLQQVEAVMGSVGRVVRVPEQQIDAVTALSGSGPAYLYLLAEAMIDAGVLLGLPRSLATDLTAQTVVGAARMLRDTGEHPAQLREAVTSPGGTTAAALRVLDERGMRAAVLGAVEAAQQRATALAGPAGTGRPR